MKYFFNPFAGEIGRLYWWVSQLLIFIFAIVLLFATAILFADPDAPVSSRNGSEISSLLAICVLAVYMNFCTSLNRLRDAGRSGWWWLAFNIPFIGSPLMLYMCGVLPGSGSLNAEYGAISALDADDIRRHHSPLSRRTKSSGSLYAACAAAFS